MAKIFAMFCAALLIPLATSVAAAPQRLPALAIEQYELPSGLAVVLQPDRGEPLVAVSVRYRAGSMHDPEGRAGLAHLVEHLMFRDSEFFARLESAGGTNINAFTTFDHTEYHELVPPEALELALWLEADRMTRLPEWTTAARVEREKAVIENELFERVNDRPYGFMQQLILEQIFPSPHPLHFGPIGTLAQLDAADLADVVLFHSTHYLPRNATIVLAGAFDPAEARAFIEKHFGSIDGGLAPERLKQPAAPIFPPRPIFGPEWIASRPLLSLFWNGPQVKDQHARSLEVFAAMLSYSHVSRASLANMRDESIEGLGAGLMQTPAGNLFRIDAVATAGVLPMLARNRVQSIIETYVLFEPQPEELEGTKRRLRLDFLRAIGSLSSRATMLQNMRAGFGDARVLMTLPARWEKVTASSIRESINRFIIGEPLFAVAQPIRR